MGLFMSVLRFVSKDIINAMGYEIRRVPRASDAAKAPVRSGDPITYQYMPRVRGSAVFEIRLEHARGLHTLGLRFDPAVHPFTRAAAAARASERPTEALREVLTAYYETVCPSTALDAVGLESTFAPGLRGVPAAGWVFPWSDKSIAESMMGRQTALRMDALQYGKMLPPSEGITAFGPVGSRKLELEISRLDKLIRSVAEHGFEPFNTKNPLKVIGLRRDKTYRWVVAAGHHRFAVCAAFAIPSVAAMVVDVVRREDCEYWPQVVTGVFSPRGALALFDRLYDGVPAPVCTGWAERAGRTAPERADWPEDHPGPRARTVDPTHPLTQHPIGRAKEWI